MGDIRPDTADLPQAEQAALLVRTPNGPTEPNEAQLLTDLFGDPNADGIFGVVADGGTDA
ncbi:hypothetical protein [Streptomyces sp. NPDC059761]|uniref:hypothetical protein n=1 Tax=Streptomyces sp. NPDC059761 TaxID=3346937 RepID=UPI003668F3DA